MLCMKKFTTIIGGENMVVAAVIGLDERRHRDVLAVEPIQKESADTYKAAFEKL
jgi:putative transposase